MSSKHFEERCQELLQSLETSGQTKPFYEIQGPMGPVVKIDGKGEIIVLCSNNYLGLADHPEVIEAGIQGLKDYGAGTASVRFICGTLSCHRQLEEEIAEWIGTPSSLSYVSCWNANEAVFPTLTGPDDILLSDELNHASIIDGCRLVSKKVEKQVYKHSDLEDLPVAHLDGSEVEGEGGHIGDGCAASAAGAPEEESADAEEKGRSHRATLSFDRCADCSPSSCSWRPSARPVRGPRTPGTRPPMVRVTRPPGARRPRRLTRRPSRPPRRKRGHM